jgi:hypothetical protein
MSKVYPLKHPFNLGDRKVTELTFNRLKGKHLKKMGQAPTIADLLELASKSACEPPALFDEMDAEDVMGVTEVIGDFLGGSPKTGGSV